MEETIISKKGGDLSRREFMRSTGLLIGGAALGAVFLSSGCDLPWAKKNEPGDPTEPELDKYTVKLLYYNCDHMTAGPTGDNLGIYKALGVNYTISGNGQVPNAFSAGQGDIGYVGVGNIHAAALAAKKNGIDKFLTVVADNFLGGSYYLVAANNIATPQDLIGKRVAFGTDPEITNSSWVAMANAIGIPIEGDNYEGINIAGDANKYMALAAGQIDAYTCCDPWGSMAVYNKVGKIMATFYDNLPGQKKADCCGLTMNDAFIKEHRGLAVKMVLAHTQAIEALYVHPVKSAMSFAKTYGTPLEVAMMTIYNKTIGEGRMMTWDMRTEPNIVTRLDNTFQYYKDIHMQDYQELIPAEDFVDYSLLDECGAKDFATFIKNEVDPIYPLGMSYDDWYKKALETDG
ncbi:MAG: ABC transporter substrate-binding protein [Dehalococcoidia bacterium]|nr:ABC transporter substrate-binding protein [Dehalococcoidia bacterium]